MMRSVAVLLLSLSWHLLVTFPVDRPSDIPQEPTTRVLTSYDAASDKTTVALAPVQISGPRDKYHSLHMAPVFSYPGQEPRRPEIIDFELRTVAGLDRRVVRRVIRREADRPSG